MIRSIIYRSAFLCVVLSTSKLFAAGYLEFDDKGDPYKWDSAVTYKLDIGKLGDIPKTAMLPLRGADGLVNDAMASWTAINATPAFANGGDVSVDITAANINTYVNFSGTSCPVSDFVVVYDDDGGIFSDLFGSSSSGILGLATPSVLSNSTKQITCGYALLNGAAVTGTGDTQPVEKQMLYTLMHELGHGRNLEHSQINGDLYTVAGSTNDQYIPLMFPIIPGNLTSAFSGGMGGIKKDDQFSLLYLYNEAVLNSEGRIKGKITYPNGKGVLGANVVCSNVASPLDNVVSFVSDSTLSGTGSYNCGHLPAGDYNVHIEPITYAINSWKEGIPPYIPTEFYNGDKESSDASVDKLDDKTNIAVTNTTISNINIVTNDNGRVVSTQTVTGAVSPKDVAPLEYFIYVPKSVTKASFVLKGQPSGNDMDLYGRCNSPFSLATDTSGPFYDPSSPDSQQADFVGASSGPSETVTLTKSTTPKVNNCEYHLLVVNYDNTNTGTFKLQVTLEGTTPVLKVDFAPKTEKQSNGETLVSEVTIEGENDQFTVSSIKFTDTGVKSVSKGTAATLYVDENNNGRVDAADTKVGTANVDGSSKTFTLANLNIFVSEGGQKKLLVTYSLPASASANVLIFLFAGLIIAGLLGGNKKLSATMIVFLSLSILVKCSSSETSDYNPTIENNDQIKATASGFGKKYTVQVGQPSDVKSFFQ